MIELKFFPDSDQVTRKYWMHALANMWNKPQYIHKLRISLREGTHTNNNNVDNTSR